MAVIKLNKSLARVILPDGILSSTKNGAASKSGWPGVLADIIAARQHEGRPFFHFWGGNTTYGDQPVSPAIRTLRLNLLEGGCKSMRGLTHVIPEAGAASATAGIYLNGDLNYIPASTFTVTYPDNVLTADIQPDLVDDDPVPTGEADEVTIGTDSQIVTSGCLYEATNPNARPEDTVTRGGYAPGADILAAQANNQSTNEVLVDRFEHVWSNRRPQAAWSGIEGTYCEFTTSSQAFRYWGDQSIGDGGTAPSLAGPADTLPVRYAGAGLRDTVRVYLWVYAAMSGATDQGEIAIANRQTDGTMGPMVQVGGAGMISGTGYLWYPAVGGAFDPTGMYFESPTEFAIDRVCLGARSTGATDTVRIAGWVMVPYHSTA